MEEVEERRTDLFLCMIVLAASGLVLLVFAAALVHRRPASAVNHENLNIATRMT